MKRDADRVWYVLRWVLLLPAVGTAFLITGALVLIACRFLDEGPLFHLAGPLCAFAWVAAACVVAPSHRTLVARAAFLLGALAALPMSRWSGHDGPTVFLLTLAGGGAAMLVFRSREKQRLFPFRCSFRTVHPVLKKGANIMTETRSLKEILTRNTWLRLATTVALLGAMGLGGLALARGLIDIVPQERRGLYMRLGKYMRTVEPGLHVKVPLVDRIIGVPVNERSGYIQHVDAMTEDNVIMRVSMQYTYEVTDPRRYRLEIRDPDFIIREFVQGTLRDVVSLMGMNEVMKKRRELSTRVTTDLTERAGDFGIRFKLVQVQGAYPPPEVEEAIKQRMVSEQRTVDAREQATQKQILADAHFYEAQKRSQAAKYEIEETAKARKESIRMVLEELAKHEGLGTKYIDFLMTQELKSNSKWILSGGATPEIRLETGQL